ncbi:MAG: right-handed parallel beta-helix repeat-containing protein, partial [Victivallales bacterium]|nr:right-handed parallel beta-helix repeat-containing protein [Victivallales bacterium]
MKMKVSLMLLCAAIIAGYGCRTRVKREDGSTYTPPDVMHLYKPRMVSAATNPLKLKPFFPPKSVGIEDGILLKTSKPIKIEGNNELAAFPGIKGKGTKDEPYIIETLQFTIDKSIGLNIEKTTKHIKIRNIKCVGVPDSAYSPNQLAGIRIANSRNVVVEHCELSKCQGIYIGGCVNVSVTDSRLISTVLGIFSSGGNHISALRNHVEDSVRYGIFLYNGPDNEIGWNYVAWTGREGIGTNGTRCQNHYYHDNLIEHCGWTAINLEGTCDNSKVVNNSVRDTFYGIILMGSNVLAKFNKVYYSGQDGFMVIGDKTKNLILSDNLIVGSAQNGIWLMPGTSSHKVAENKILLSNYGIKNNASDTTITENYIERFFWAIETSKPAKIAQNVFKQGKNGVNVTKGVIGATIEKNELSYLCIGTIVSGGDKTKIFGNKFIYVGQHVQLYGSKNLE